MVKPTQPATIPNDALLREVDDDLRAERMQRLWQQYRQPFFIVVGLLVAFVAGTSIWEEQQAKKAGAALLKLDAGILLLQKDKPKAAADQFAMLAEESTGELHDVAQLWQARALASADQAEASLNLLKGIAEKPAGKDLVWRDMACLRLQAANVEAPKACASTEASPLRATRLEWQAALLWKDGKTDEAKKLLAVIADDKNATSEQRARAASLQRALAAEVK